MKFSHLPIRQKLIRLVVTTCGIVLLLAMVVFLVFEALSIRRVTTRAVETLARAIAFNSSAALAFDDPVDGEHVLRSLRAEQFVRYAGLYDADGKLFAAYPPHAAGLGLPETLQDGGEAGFNDGYFDFYQPVAEGSVQWGTLFISYELTMLRERLLWDSLVALLVLGVAVGASYFIAVFIQRSVSNPIVELAGVARRVSREHNFGLRAEKQSRDEVGDLTDAFNEMLQELGKKEVALLRSEERLRLTMEASRTGTWNLDLATGKLEVEGHVFEVLPLRGSQMTMEDLVRMSVHPDDRERVTKANRESMEGGRVLDITFRVILRDGSVRHYSVRGNVSRESEGKRAQMLGVAIDVTAAREAEEEILRLNRDLEQRVQDRTAELQNAVEEIESFSYSVSHDLRAPLRSLDGFSRILLAEHEEKLDEEGQDFLRRIRASAQKMGQLIEDLLMLSRVTRQQMKREAVDLTKMAEEILWDFRRQEPERNVRSEIGPGMMAMGDENLLRIALQNLLANAWKFTSGVDAAMIEVGCRRENGEQVFFVRDNGAGFDLEHAGKLFMPFQRLHGATEFEGTGVGLATVKRILNRHGGKIRATAEVNKGATFYFTLPDAREDEAGKPDVVG